MAEAGTALIWSPRSNLELYGDTADIPLALSHNVTIALAPDWAPTGSSNMLAEIGYADSVVQTRLGAVLSEKQLFEMATVTPARIAHIDDKVGALIEGNYADLFLLHGDASDPYRALAHAKPQDTTLVLVGGQPIYGLRSNLAALGIIHIEDVEVCPGNFDHGLNGEALEKPFAAVLKSLDSEMSRLRLVRGPLVECQP